MFRNPKAATGDFLALMARSDSRAAAAADSVCPSLRPLPLAPWIIIRRDPPRLLIPFRPLRFNLPLFLSTRLAFFAIFRVPRAFFQIDLD